MMDGIECPFCSEDGFDLVGLKLHLVVGGVFYPPCKAFEDTSLDYAQKETSGRKPPLEMVSRIETKQEEERNGRD